MTLSVNTIVTAMVAASFRSYTCARFAADNATWRKIFAVLIVLAMSGVNIAGSTNVARTQTVVVYVVIGILVTFAVVMLANINTSLLAPSGYPPVRDIVSSAGLSFSAFLGFGSVPCTANDLRQGARELARALFLAIGIGG